MSNFDIEVIIENYLTFVNATVLLIITIIYNLVDGLTVSFKTKNNNYLSGIILRILSIIIFSIIPIAVFLFLNLGLLTNNFEACFAVSLFFLEILSCNNRHNASMKKPSTANSDAIKKRLAEARKKVCDISAS